MLLAICIVVVSICIAWIIGAVLLAASVLELSTSGLLVSLGTIALAVGLVLKDSFASLANGILIIINKPFRCGDFVSINGIEGKVHNIKLLTVELITFANVGLTRVNNTFVL